jgi:hypothetical protein
MQPMSLEHAADCFASERSVDAVVWTTRGPCTCAAKERQRIAELEEKLKKEVDAAEARGKKTGRIAELGALHNALYPRISEPDTDKIHAAVVGLVEDLERELHEVKVGYHLLDENWDRMHNAAMNPIRKAAGNGTVSEIVAAIEHAMSAVKILRASGAVPPAMAQLNEENYQAWQAWLEADGAVHG